MFDGLVFQSLELREASKIRNAISLFISHHELLGGSLRLGDNLKWWPFQRSEFPYSLSPVRGRLRCVRL